jgi:hypothetical protein
MTVPASTIGSGKFCVITVTNADGMYAIYSGISMKPPSLNLPNFDTTTPSLTIPRRAPALVFIKLQSSFLTKREKQQENEKRKKKETQLKADKLFVTNTFFLL